MLHANSLRNLLPLLSFFCSSNLSVSPRGLHSRSPGDMRPNNALWYWGLSFCIGHCTLCLVVSVLLRLLLLLLFFPSSLSIGVFFVIFVYQWRQCFWGLCCPSYPPTALSPFCIGEAPQPCFFQPLFFSIRILSCLFSHISVWRVSSLRSAGALANMVASSSVSSVRRRVFGVKCKVLGVSSDV